MGRVDDPRASDALDEIERSRRADGRWLAQGQWWKSLNGSVAPEAADWGRSGEPSEMITLNCLRVLRAAGRSGGS
jgi:hypothetical protein